MNTGPLQPSLWNRSSHRHWLISVGTTDPTGLAAAVYKVYDRMIAHELRNAATATDEALSAIVSRSTDGRSYDPPP